jgi:hypothetical protein
VEPHWETSPEGDECMSETDREKAEEIGTWGVDRENIRRGGERVLRKLKMLG